MTALTVLLPTVGRPTLPRMLQSLGEQDWRDGDELLLVSDGRHDWCQRVFRESGLPGRHFATPGGPRGDWGHTQRNWFMRCARGEYLWHIDDDDVALPGALANIRAGIAARPGALHLFRFMTSGGQLVWDRRGTREDWDWGCGTSCLVHPRDIDLGSWAPFYGGDRHFIHETIRRNPGRDVEWQDRVVYYWTARDREGASLEELYADAERHLRGRPQDGADRPPPRFTFLLPTVGRPTLKRMLESLAAQALHAGEEVLLVSDDRHEEVGKVWRACGLAGTHLAVASGPLRGRGHPIRRLLAGGTYRDYVWHLDDDDVLAPDAVARVRRVVARSRLPLYLFRFWCAASKRFFWEGRDRGFLDQVGAHNVIHAARLPLADWPDAYNGDGAFIAETCRSNGLRPCWRPEVIYLANPGAGSLKECWRRLPPEPPPAVAAPDPGVTLDSIPGYFDFRDYYDLVAGALPDGATLVEVGNLYGKSLAYLADVLKRGGRPFALYGVDHGIDTADGTHDVICGELLRNLRALGLERETHLLVMPSQQAAQLFADGSLDFVFIDAAHGFEDVRADLTCWWPKVKPGGLLAGHDYTESWPGVVRAVDEFFDGRARRPAVASQSCWEVRKP